jgi:hypothetical protein
VVAAAIPRVPAGGRSPTRSPARRAPRAWGVIAALAYLAAGSWVWPAVPLRILYEGEAPPLPYRWVRPPASLPEPNQAPTPGTGTIPLTSAGSQSASVLTDDGQAALIFRFGAIAPQPGASSVSVRIVPVDPATLPPPPPGLAIDGNAYRMDAAYNTGAPVRLLKPVTPVLRYPRHATVLLRLSGGAWVSLETHIVSGSLQIFGPTDSLGTFAAGRPAGAGAAGPWTRPAAIAAAALALAAALGLRFFARRRQPAAGAGPAGPRRP